MKINSSPSVWVACNSFDFADPSKPIGSLIRIPNQLLDRCWINLALPEMTKAPEVVELPEPLVVAGPAITDIKHFPNRGRLDLKAVTLISIALVVENPWLRLAPHTRLA